MRYLSWGVAPNPKVFIGFLPTKVPQGSAMQICSENPDIGIRAAGVSVLGFRMKNIQ
jgi:hypothetical protein